ncbi:MAG: hypothetical protein AB7S26_09265 [Sandaracinaceae bacterium]
MEERDGGDDATLVDLPAVPPAYEHHGKTIEERVSPFASRAPRGRTTPGIAAARFDPSAAVDGVPLPPSSGPILVPPDEVHDSLGGSTLPDGIPTPPWDAIDEDGAGPSGAEAVDYATDPEADLPPASTEVSTDPPPRPVGRVPSPDEPRVQVSKSLELDLRALEEKGELDPRIAAAAQELKKKRRPRAVEAPTEVMLPALERKREVTKEGSDVPLLVLLAIVGVVIVALAFAVVWGVLRMM